MRKIRNAPKPVREFCWRWVTLGGGERLHRVCQLNIEQIEAADNGMHGRGKTVCGRTGDLAMPGIISRMGMARCHQCCKGTQIPDGLGNPFNDKKLKEIADR